MLFVQISAVLFSLCLIMNEVQQHDCRFAFQCDFILILFNFVACILYIVYANLFVAGGIDSGLPTSIAFLRHFLSRAENH